LLTRLKHFRPFSDTCYQGFRRSVYRSTAEAKLKDVIHTLRHTTASRRVMRGIDIYRVMAFMRHANVKTTMRYAHLAPNSLDGLAQALEPAPVTLMYSGGS
jgi:site-specific recombinase XerD